MGTVGQVEVWHTFCCFNQIFSWYNGTWYVWRHCPLTGGVVGYFHGELCGWPIGVAAARDFTMAAAMQYTEQLLSKVSSWAWLF